MQNELQLNSEEFNYIQAFLHAVEQYNELTFDKCFAILNEEELLIGSESIQNKTPYIYLQKVENINSHTFDSPIESEITLTVRNILSPRKQPRYFGFRIENSTFNGFRTYINNDPLGPEGDKRFELLFQEKVLQNSGDFDFLNELVSGK